MNGLPRRTVFHSQAEREHGHGGERDAFGGFNLELQIRHARMRPRLDSSFPEKTIGFRATPQSRPISLSNACALIQPSGSTRRWAARNTRRRLDSPAATLF